MGSKGAKEIVQEIINFYKINREGYPYELIYKLTQLYFVIEDTYSVSSATELQEAIDSIGSGAGTIFIASGTYDVEATIDIDGCGSYVIYGHGDNTILKPADGITVFNITCCDSCIIKTLKIDTSNYTLPYSDTNAIDIDEASNNVIALNDITIIGDTTNKYGVGIFLSSDNCIIEHCNMTYLRNCVWGDSSNNHSISHNIMGYCSNNAFYAVNGTNLSLIGNNINNNSSDGINMGACERCTITANNCGSNNRGIYASYLDYSTVTGNICNSNSGSGIVVYFCDYSVFSSNTCNSNTGGASTGGIYVLNSTYNTITANSCNSNTGYGIALANAACIENVIAANNANNNTLSDFYDAGTATTIEYYVQSTDELQDAIDSIGSKAGIINIDASFSVATTIDIDGGGSYIIRGEGSNSTLTPSDNITCINITSARSVLLENFKIDVSAWTVAGNTQEVIDITEASNNLVIIDNVEIEGNDYGYGIEANSKYVQIKNSNISTLNIGIRLLGNNCSIEQCNISSCDGYGIDATGDYCNISHNDFATCDQGIQLNGANYCGVDSNIFTATAGIAGIYVFNLTGANISNNTVINGTNGSGIILDQATYCIVIGNICNSNASNSATQQGGIIVTTTSIGNYITENTCNNNSNAGAEEGYGICIMTASCTDNIVRSNTCSGNDIEWKDIGVNSDFEYRCSTGAEIQQAIDSIAAKSGIVHVVSGTIALSSTIDIDGNGDYIIEGEGVGSVIDCAGDRTAFDITSIASLTIRELKIDSSDISTATKEIIKINKGSNDTPVHIENITITGDADKKGYGIYVTASDYVVINGCNITYCYHGIHITGSDKCVVNNCITNYNGYHGIYLNDGEHISVQDCECRLNISGGIYLNDNIDNSYIRGNNCSDNKNTGGTGINSYGIYIGTNSTVNNIVANYCYSIIGYDADGIGIYCNSPNNLIISNYIGNTQQSGVLGYAYGMRLESSAVNLSIANNNCCNVISGDKCNNSTIIGNILNPDPASGWAYGSISMAASTGNITGLTISGNVSSQGDITVTSGLNCVIVGNSMNNNASTGGINIGQCKYCLISSNTCDSNKWGIRIYSGTLCDYNTISSNILTNNTTSGIDIEDNLCDSNIIIGNIFDNNGTDIVDNGTDTVLYADDTAYGASWNGDLGTATKNAIYDIIEAIIATIPTIEDDVYGAGWNGDLNATSKNSIYDAGFLQNVVEDTTPQLGGNLDAQGYEIQDVNIINDKIYYVATDAELDAAISDINSNNYDGEINIIANLSNVQVTINDADSSYIIQGSGDNISLDANGNNSVFTITACKYCRIRNLEINANDITGTTTAAISITEASNNPVIIENVLIDMPTNLGYGIDVNSSNVTVKDCIINGGVRGIDNSAIENQILDNKISDIVGTPGTDGGGSGTAGYGIVNSGNICSIIGNTIHTVTGGAGDDEPQLGGWGAAGYGIYNAASFCLINDNVIYTVTGGKGGNGNPDPGKGGDGYGIYINAVDDNIVGDNLIYDIDGGAAGTGSPAPAATIGVGIYLNGDADRNLIADNIIRNAGDDGIRIAAATGDDNQLSDNYITGYGTNRVNDSGTNTIYGARYS